MTVHCALGMAMPADKYNYMWGACPAFEPYMYVQLPYMYVQLPYMYV